MRYIDFSLIDENDPDVVEWINDSKNHFVELSKKATHNERKDYMNNNKFSI